jgi:hypothetical protein
MPPQPPKSVAANPAGAEGHQYVSLEIVTEGVTILATLAEAQARALGVSLLRYVPSDMLRREAESRGLQVTEPEWEILSDLGSSAIDKVAYRERDQTLVLLFHRSSARAAAFTGAPVTRYAQVPRAIFDGFKSALSVGTYYHEVLRGRFPSMRGDAFPGA